MLLEKLIKANIWSALSEVHDNNENPDNINKVEFFREICQLISCRYGLNLGLKELTEAFICEYNEFHGMCKKYYDTTMMSQNSSINETEKEIFSQTGRYHYEFSEYSEIDSGSYGVVCKALKKLDNAKYALKKINLGSGIDKTKLSEIKFWSKLDHRYIARYKSSWIEIGEWILMKDNTSKILPNQHILFIQMELCKMTLRTAMNKINTELNQNDGSRKLTHVAAYLFSEFFKEIVEGVHYLHSQPIPIIHRDLKLSNILLAFINDKYSIKISDFGLATIHCAEDIDETEVGNFDLNHAHTQNRGTLMYMANEVKHGKYDTPADVYSLGVMLGELFQVKNIDSCKTDTYYKLRNEYYPTKQIGIMRKLKHENVSFRPSCDEILKSKHEWAVDFDEIKATDNLMDIIYDYKTKQFFNNKREDKKLSASILIQKCFAEAEEKYRMQDLRRLVFTSKFKHFEKMRSVINTQSIQTKTNIKEKNVRTKILKIVLHSIIIEINFMDLCEFVEKSLNKLYNNYWHCFYDFKNASLRQLINWFNCPYYIVSFSNEFSNNVLNIIIINTPNISIEKLSESFVVKKVMDKYMSEQSKQSAFRALEKYKDLDEIEAIKKMRLEIVKNFNILFKGPEYKWDCYITKNELISFFELYPNPKYQFAIRIRDYCFLITSEKLITIDINLCSLLYTDIGLDHKIAILSAFHTNVCWNLCLKRIKLHENCEFMLRVYKICDSIPKNYQSFYRIFGNNVEIFHVNNDENHDLSPISIGNTKKSLFQKYNLREGDVISLRSNLKNMIDENSSFERLLDALKSIRKILSKRFNKSFEYIIGLLCKDVYELFDKNWHKSDNSALQVSALQTVNRCIDRLLSNDHLLVTSSLILIYSKLLKQEDDNICFHVIQGLNIILLHCDECHKQTIETNFLDTFLALNDSKKSSAFIIAFVGTLVAVAIPPNSILQEDLVEKIMNVVKILIYHTDNHIVLSMFTIMQRFITSGYKAQPFINSGIFPSLLMFLTHNDPSVQKKALSVVHLSIKDYNVTSLLNVEELTLLYSKLATLLKFEYHLEKIYVIVVFYSIKYENNSHFQAILDSKLIAVLIDIVQNGIYLTQYNAAKIINLIFQMLNAQQLSDIYSTVCDTLIESLCELLAIDHESLLINDELRFINIWDIISSVLDLLINKCVVHRTQIQRKILNCIENNPYLTIHKNETVVKRANDFIDYFLNLKNALFITAK